MSNGHAHHNEYLPPPLPRKEPTVPEEDEDEDSVSEEDDPSRLVAHPGGGANLGVPSADLHRVTAPTTPSPDQSSALIGGPVGFPRRAPSDASSSNRGDVARNRRHNLGVPSAALHRGTLSHTPSPIRPSAPPVASPINYPQPASDVSSYNSNGTTPSRRKSLGFFASLFKKKSKERIDSSLWDTRTPRNLVNIKEANQRASSDDESDSRNLVKVVNEVPELWQQRARGQQQSLLRSASVSPSKSDANEQHRRLRKKSLRKRTLSDSATTGLAERLQAEDGSPPRRPGAAAAQGKSDLSRESTVKTVSSLASDTTVTSAGTAPRRRRPASTSVEINNGQRQEQRRHRSLLGILESSPEPDLATRPDVAVVTPPSSQEEKLSRSYVRPAVPSPTEKATDTSRAALKDPSSTLRLPSQQSAAMALTSSVSTTGTAEDVWEDALEDVGGAEADGERTPIPPPASTTATVVPGDAVLKQPTPTYPQTQNGVHVLPRSALVHRTQSPTPSSTLSSVPTTTRAKSVRLAPDVKFDNDEAHGRHLHAHFAPASTSGRGRSSGGNNGNGVAGPSSSRTSNTEVNNWTSRVDSRRSNDDYSSDEDKTAQEYSRARRAMVAGAESFFSMGPSKKKNKGKGKAVN
jgi:hypothetical protein